MKSLWVKSIWVKNMGENRGRWDAGFRSPLLRYIYMLYTTHTHTHIYIYIYVYKAYCFVRFWKMHPHRMGLRFDWQVGSG